MVSWSRARTCAKNKAGALLSLPNGSAVVPRPVRDVEQDWLAAVTTGGRLLLFKVSDLPQLGKGKGNKIIGIPGERVPAARSTSPTWVLPAGATLVLQAGKRTLSLKGDDRNTTRGAGNKRAVSSASTACWWIFRHRIEMSRYRSPISHIRKENGESGLFRGRLSGECRLLAGSAGFSLTQVVRNRFRNTLCLWSYGAG